jgi:non-specific serine/threonine protein kinase
MIYRELLDTLEIGVCIERLAWMASAREQAERSARLFGAAETIRQSVGVALPRPYEPDHRRWMAAARLHLGEGAFEAAWAEGRALGLEAAIDLARADGAAGGTDEPGGLTPREREVAVLVARGLTNRQIAAHLVISERTAEAHVANIRTKLEFSRRAQIAAWAVDSGLVPPGAEPPTSP